MKILNIQKKVIRMMTGLKKGESCKQKFKELRILTVTSLYVLEVLCYMKKYKGSILENSEIHDHSTRRKKDLHIQSCRTVMSKLRPAGHIRPPEMFYPARATLFLIWRIKKNTSQFEPNYEKLLEMQSVSFITFSFIIFQSLIGLSITKNTRIL